MSKFNYGTWRTDVPKEEGFSHELISADSQIIVAKGATLDDLHSTPYDGVATLYDAMKRNVKLIPNNDLLGTQCQEGEKTVYKWISHKDVADTAEKLSYGMVALELCP